ncbi:uncharacterized protein [Epargyreus clarus]|uniref:uncharacterized protein n=1 Tax=Epargyreus clarus TaxID=520877 RepID=UPI003C2D73A7
MHIALVQEPYVGKAGVIGQYPGTKIIQCSQNRQKPVKAAILVFGEQLEITHDPQLVTETEAAALITAGQLKIGIVSVYFEGDKDIEPYLARTRSACQALQTKNLVVAGDVNAWSHWWGSSYENPRGTAYSTFLNDMELEVLNTGRTPTFETYRGDRLFASIVDVTACSQSLLGRVEDWRVNGNITTSDHNAITFVVRLDAALTTKRAATTRVYNTKKANWPEFRTRFRTLLEDKNITTDAIREGRTPEDLEAMVAAYTSAIQEACDTTIPRTGLWKGNTRLPWWSKTLEEALKDTHRKKRRIRNAAPHRRETVIKEYLQAKEAYTQQAQDAQTKSWKEFCTTQERESMWDGIYRVIRRTARKHEDLLLQDATGRTLTPDKSAKLLADTFYPEDSATTDDQYHMLLRRSTEDQLETSRQLSADDPKFTPAELDLVLKAMNPKKAPGSDGLTADICTEAIQSGREVFMAIANKCLELAHFPKQWKTAHVVILRKPGKDDYTKPKSYRPIGLLPVMGKIIEKLMVGRIQWHILPTLNKTQYGFTPQRGTEDALYDLMEFVRSEVNNKKIVLMVSLDIEGAFDNAWWPALKHQLKKRKCPGNIYAMVSSYLKDRTVKINYAGAAYEKETTKGCVQGSIGGPTFWNIILDPLLDHLTGKEVHCQAFADDIVLVFSSAKIETLENSANNALTDVVKWGTRNKLSFAAHKTNALLITKKLKYEPPKLYMSGTRLHLVKEMKLLGLIIDNKLTFKSHVAATCKKAADIYKQLACAAKVTWGLNTEIVRTIYVAVIEPIVTYASSVWFQATDLQMNKSQLEALQRGFAQKTCKAYRTVSLTAALVLSGLLPLDLRIHESASLYRAKKNISLDYIPPGRKLERMVRHEDLPHPSTLTTINYQVLESVDPQTMATHRVVGPQIYTDGSKIEGMTGAALTWWEDGKETSFSTYSLDSSCTVFQAELYALHKAVEQAVSSGRTNINILSDSRSSLELLANPKPTHPLTKAIKDNIRGLRREKKNVQLFWIRAHVGTAGNERADELAKTAAKNMTETPDYAETPLSYVKRKIREETILKWQDRYTTSSTGSVTKTFFPDVGKAYTIIRKTKLTQVQVQALTGHGGMGEYLYRFKLKDSPGCECDPNTSETVWHVILECPRFLAIRTETESIIGAKLEKPILSDIMGKEKERKCFLEYLDSIFRVVAKRNSTLSQAASQPTTTLSRTLEINEDHSAQTPNPLDNSLSAFTNLLQQAEQGEPCLRIRGVALFMDSNSERFGISFCNTNCSGRVAISPGLAALLNGSTFRATMKRSTYNALSEISVANTRCKIVRSRNKTIALFEGSDNETQFAQACAILLRLGDPSENPDTTPRVLSLDAMVVGYIKGRAEDHMGSLKASEKHEVVVYEDRGENLSFLKPRQTGITTALNPVDRWGHPVACPEEVSGSERLQQTRAAENTTAGEKLAEYKERRGMLSAIMRTFKTVSQHIPGKKLLTDQQTPTTSTSKNDPLPAKTALNKAEKGLVEPPNLRDAKNPLDHIINAFLEFKALTVATMEDNRRTCDNILQSFLQDDQKLLKERLEKSEAAIYDNNTSQNIMGEETSRHMAAYSATRGFIARDEEESKRTGREKFCTPPDDPIIVIARCTRIMLDDKILAMADSLSGEHGITPDTWEVPKLTWVNGVPGCGKSTWIVDHYREGKDLIITTTTEAARDLRTRLIHRTGTYAQKRVRTMASLLVNGSEKSYERLLIDEALMNHFGAIVMAIRLTGATEALLAGDINQLPYIERNNLFELLYSRPTPVAKISQELLCTHRNPKDVAYALSEVYSGIYSSVPRTRSLQLKRYTDASIPKSLEKTLYLVHTQSEKESLKTEGFGSGKGSCILTIHEAQGSTYETVVIVRTSTQQLRLHDSVPHAVVAVSRHTISCTYYSDYSEDAIAQFIRKAMTATDEKLEDYNTSMAIRSRDLKALGKSKDKLEATSAKYHNTV